jgi:hypothetical protein
LRVEVSVLEALLFDVEEDLVARGLTAFSFTTEAADSAVLLVFFDGLLDCMSSILAAQNKIVSFCPLGY